MVVRANKKDGVGGHIATYASSNCIYDRNTIADSTAGLSLYTRSGFTGPGLAFGTNNIVWGTAEMDADNIDFTTADFKRPAKRAARVLDAPSVASGLRS